jgi:exopolysaccharide biosynthesis protein
LRVVDNPDGQSLGAMMKREKFVCGVNGGYFDTEFKPIGLRVADGTTFSPLRRARLITGILLQSDRGIDVIRVSEFSGTKKIIAAVQSGPFLVEGNKPIRGLNDSQLARRTFAGQRRMTAPSSAFVPTFRLPNWQTFSPRRPSLRIRKPAAQ